MKMFNTQRGVAAAAILAALLAAGCTDKSSAPGKAKTSTSTVTENDPRAKVLGVEHVGVAKETPGTTSPVKSEISKAQQENAMPMPGQANYHSTLTTKATQKAAPTGH